MKTSEAFDFLLSHGIRHVIALQYAHKPGIFGKLHRYMVEKCAEFKGRVTGMATFFLYRDTAGALDTSGDSG